MRQAAAGSQPEPGPAGGVSSGGATTAVALLRAEKITKRYQTGASVVTVFDQLHLELEAGECVALVGASGAGKSSLLHLLGLLDTPTAGHIYLRDREVTGLPAAAQAEIRNREIGFVWQMSTLLPDFSAEENVMMPLIIRGVSRSAAQREARDRLAEVGLEARTHHRAGELSGGEQQRVVLARALVGDPALLLADEPTGSLDERTGEAVMDLLARIHEKRRAQGRQLTFLYVTHNPSFATRAQRILELRQGVLHATRGQ